MCKLLTQQSVCIRSCIYSSRPGVSFSILPPRWTRSFPIQFGSTLFSCLPQPCAHTHHSSLRVFSSARLSCILSSQIPALQHALLPQWISVVFWGTEEGVCRVPVCRWCVKSSLSPAFVFHFVQFRLLLFGGLPHLLCALNPPISTGARKIGVISLS